MTFRFRILGSSSKGNAALLETSRSRILIDAGFSGRRLEAMLREADCPIESVQAVFLTHEHADHASGLKGLSRYSHLQFFANAATAREISKKLSRPIPWRHFSTGDTFHFEDLEVDTFAVPHDAADPVGYRFTAGEDNLFEARRTLAWATDLGYVSDEVRDKVCAADLLVLEANYDEELLEASQRSFSLKQRIRGRHGHLGNTAAHELLASVEKPRWSRVILAHLSEECNCPRRVRELFGSLTAAFTTEVIDPSGPMGPALEF